MNRLALGVLLVAMALGACAPAPSDAAAQATSRALVSTSSARTLAVLPTLTNPPTNTALPTQPATPTATQTATETLALTDTATATATGATGTATATGTLPTPTVSPTGTPPSPTNTTTGTPPTPTSTPTGTPPTATATDLMVTRVYGTQPPYVDYGRIELRNQSKTQVYISFQCTTPEGYYVIVEYPVEGTIKVSVPAGRCAYVAWIGGREFTGEFGLKPFEELIFTFKKTGVTIQ